MKVDEEVEIVHDAEISRNKHDVNVDSIVIYDMSNDLTFQFKKHLKEEDDVERKKKG
jgi:predicted dinucleotide-utilizing enzyme